ncbi:hypothetical protein NPIL_132291 [Nephila pilipes]|uniref:Uncharacterized protein n=1 Tax=Nephila pilipes TaxID=299642 RepID=A0A8X6TYF2_NEPPI|nr:hypothetical protein NPIL_132291 [Nephila pilipes]
MNPQVMRSRKESDSGTPYTIPTRVTPRTAVYRHFEMHFTWKEEIPIAVRVVVKPTSSRRLTSDAVLQMHMTQLPARRGKEQMLPVEERDDHPERSFNRKTLGNLTPVL